MTYIEKAIQIVKSECYVNNPLNLDRSMMINEALDTLIGAAEKYDDFMKEPKESKNENR